MGSATLVNNTGIDNTAIGYNAGNAGTIVTTGSQNTFVGSGTGIAAASASQYSNSTALGYNAAVTASNQMVFGNSSVILQVMSGSGAMVVPIGTYVQGGSGNCSNTGGMRYQTDAGTLGIGAYLCNGTNWVLMTGSGGSGGGTSINLLTDAIADYVNNNILMGGAAADTSYALSSHTALYNTAVGVGALLADTTGGNNNSAFGYNALNLNAGGLRNTAMGANALANVTGNNDNTAMGYGALMLAQNPIADTALGSLALYNNTTGQVNTAIGYSALYNNVSKSGQYGGRLWCDVQRRSCEQHVPDKQYGGRLSGVRRQRRCGQ